VACRSEFTGSYEKVFNSWFLERKQQLDQSLSTTVANGNLTTARNPWKIFVRDWLLWFIQLVPSWRHQLELGPRAYGMGRYTFSNGMAFLPDFAGGRCLPQVYCRSVYPLATSDVEGVRFTDDLLLNGPRTGNLLHLLVLVDGLQQAEEAWQELKKLDLSKCSGGEVQAESAFFLIHSPGIKTQRANITSDIPQDSVYRIATAEEFAATELCRNRPYPIGYDAHRIKKDVRGRKYVLVRPDRFVYAACSTGAELSVACDRIPTTLLGSSTSTDSQDCKF
jgi:hypothetical protein